MKPFCLFLGLALVAGCREDAPRQPDPRAARAAPPQAKSLTSPAADASSGQTQEPEADGAGAPPLITGESWMQRELSKQEHLRLLREYSAKADPDDPFALTEEKINALSKLDDVVIY